MRHNASLLAIDDTIRVLSDRNVCARVPMDPSADLVPPPTLLWPDTVQQKITPVLPTE
jgi:hypothetical protein